MRTRRLHLGRAGARADPDRLQARRQAAGLRQRAQHFGPVVADAVAERGEEHRRLVQAKAQRGRPMVEAVAVDELPEPLRDLRVVAGCRRDVHVTGENQRALVGQQAHQLVESLVTQFDAGLDAVRAAVASQPRVPVLILTGRQLRDMTRFHTVGGTSFISELVDVAGGANIYADAGQPYIEASKETVVMRAPQAVIEIHAGQTLPEDIQAQYIADWRQLPSLPAVQNGRIYLVTDSHAMRPGPRAPEIAARIARLLHPEAESELENHAQTP